MLLSFLSTLLLVALPLYVMAASLDEIDPDFESKLKNIRQSERQVENNLTEKREENLAIKEALTNQTPPIDPIEATLEEKENPEPKLEAREPPSTQSVSTEKREPTLSSSTEKSSSPQPSPKKNLAKESSRVISRARVN
jgi:septal ring factor EnvC (AmiA/AmiB activator)